MNFPGYNPSMLNNMNVDQMKMASDMLSGMSDEQLRGYAKMMGMPNMDPQMLRNNAGMMKNMNESQFSQMKDTAKNFKPGQFGGAGPSAFPTANTTNTSTTSSTPTNQATTSTSRYAHIEKLKNKGNDLFKKGSYSEAATAYFEAIIEIEEIRSSKRNNQDDELDTLEVSCRLNYANVKAKENEFDVVLTQSKAVLKVKENGKAYFRLGQALYHYKKYEEALKNLETAVSLLPGDDTVADYRNKARKEVEAVKKAQTETENKAQDPLDFLGEAIASKEEKKEEVQEKPAQEEGKPKMKKKAAPEVDVPITEKPAPTQNKFEPTFDYLGSQKEEKTEKSTEKKDVVIEEEKVTETKPATTSSSSSRTTTVPSSSFAGGYPGNLSEDKIKQGQQELGNMNPDQLKMMTDYFKTMDNASLKNMLRMQSGMDISDDQLESMKMMMTPEMLQGFSKMDLNNMPRNPNQFASSTTTAAPTSTASSGTTATAEQSTAQAQPQFPMGGMGMGAGGMPNIDFKSDQIQAMLDMVASNPEMLKNMVGMLGEDNPAAKFLKNKSPETLQKYVKVVQKLLKVYGKVSPLVTILRKYWQLIMGIMIGYIVYKIVS